MGRIVRLNISLDNSHSLDDFPVDLYSGLTSGDTTNLVYANIVSEDIPLDLMFEDSDLNISNDPNNPFVPHCYMRISSDGCYDEIIKLEVPRVDCEICVDFQEIIPEPTPTSIPPTPTSIPPTPTSIPPTATEGPTPTPTPTLPPGPTPTPTSTPTPTPSSTPGERGCRFVFVPDTISTTGYGLDYVQNGVIILTRFTDIAGQSTTYDGVVGTVFGVCSETYPLYYDFDGGQGAITDPIGVERPPNGGSCSINKSCIYTPPTPTPTSTDTPTTCNEYSLYMTGQGETSSQWEWTTCGGSTTTWTNVGSNYRVVCSETTPTLNYGDGFSLLNGDCGNYTVSRCTDGQQFTVAKNKNCMTGTPPTYSVGDVIQFKQMNVTNGSCYGETYCGTITATDSNTPHNALVSRNATVDDCNDTTHCGE